MLEVAETEESVISILMSDPSKRDHFLQAAHHFDKIGELEIANSFHNGVIPKSIISKHGLDPFSSVAPDKSRHCTRVLWSPPHTEKLTPPINTDTSRNTVFQREHKECPPEFLDILNDGHFVYNGMDKLFVDPDNVRINNHSDINSYLLQRNTGDQKQKLNGLSVLLAARNANNFYHWHFDILPVLGMLESSGIPLTEIDNIVVQKNSAGFQAQMLTALGVRDSQLKPVAPGNQPFSCDQLVLPRIHNAMGLRQPRRHLDWLRSKFLHTSDIAANETRKIAIMRKQRGFENQVEIEECLARSGYDSIYPEQHSYLEQIAIFASASHIVAPHGAALSLLVFCKPGTVVHEIYGEHVHPCFWSLSSTLGLKYHNYNCSGISSEEVTNGGRGLAERAKKTIHVPASVLEQILST